MNNCDGNCYGCFTDLPKGHPDRVEMCPMVDTCEKTRNKEFFATVFAGIVYILLMLSPWILMGVLLYVSLQ